MLQQDRKHQAEAWDPGLSASSVRLQRKLRTWAAPHTRTHPAPSQQPGGPWAPGPIVEEQGAEAGGSFIYPMLLNIFLHFLKILFKMKLVKSGA